MLSHIRREDYRSEPQILGAYVGWVILVTAAAGLVSPKTLAFSAPCTILAVLLSWHGRPLKFPGGALALYRPREVWYLTTFFFYLLLTLTWSANAGSGFVKICVLILLILGSVAGCRLIRSETNANISRMAEGLWFGLLIGSIYLAWDLVAHRGTYSHLSLIILQKYIKLGQAEVTRSITPVTLLLGPALLSIMAGLRKPWQTAVVCAVVTLATLVVSVSPHETSKIGMIGWMFFWSLATVSGIWAHRMILAVWFSACILVVPVALLAYRLDLQHSHRLQETAQARILIWHEFATRVVGAPLLGHGFNMSNALRPVTPGVGELSYLSRRIKVPANLKPFRAAHPHNVFLQIWFEFGAVGMFLFFVAGLGVIQRIKGLDQRQKPALYATAVATIAILFSSYGLWQYWFFGLFAFVMLACAISLRISRAPAASTCPQPRLMSVR
jgi:hypothetical protein